MDWKKLVGSVAPVLGGTLGGPFGAIAGKWLSKELGVEENNLEETISNADPKMMLKIKTLDVNFKKQMTELGLKEKQLFADDRSSARNLAINTTLLPQAIISSIFILGFITVLVLVFSGAVKLEGTTQQIGNILLGILSAGIMQIMNFFFGSSSGSKEKTSILGQQK